MDRVYLRDYQPADFLVTQTIMHFDLGAESTRVKVHYSMQKTSDHNVHLKLDGEQMQLHSVHVDGVLLSPADYTQTENALLVHAELARVFTLSCEVTIRPIDNTQLSGLYVSDDNLCTQCEATGFRRIVYSLDRPDVLSSYQVSMTADSARYPVLLANGDCVRSEQHSDGTVTKTFVDPAPKPSYLFALVAGQFNHLHRVYTSSKGREHQLYIYLPKSVPIEQAAFAMDSLVLAMQWDEQKYDCHYDLNAYYIVAMADFNFGAMENKGLNIFNTSTLLAAPDVVTDTSYLRVLSVVGHEYFHNWTGNRVTLRDWFQLSLKEGLTTYREMRFSVDTYGPLARLDYIFDLVERQFTEDKGPAAHPILPDSYVSIDNFYTATTYTKGAEVLRMLEDLVGYDALTQGICKYLQAFDGKAATLDDFLAVLEAQCPFDMARFKVWYVQPGTPKVTLRTNYDVVNKRLCIEASQTADLDKYAADYQAKLLPIVCRLYDYDGVPVMPQVLEGEGEIRKDDFVLFMSSLTQAWQIPVTDDAILSAFRGLSAPVKHEDDLSRAQIKVLVGCDNDHYVRYQYCQNIWLDILSQVDDIDLSILDQPIAQASDEPALVSSCMRIPTLRHCMETVGGFDFDLLSARHDLLSKTVGRRWHKVWLDVFQSLSVALQGGYKWQPDLVNARHMRGIALYYMLQTDHEAISFAQDLYYKSDNLTDKCAALEAVTASDCNGVEALLDDFYQRCSQHELMLDRWFRMAAASKHNASLERLEQLLSHQACQWQRPNRIMACMAGWWAGNYSSLHAADGKGYALLKRCVLKMDALNPSSATRMLKPLLYKDSFDSGRAEKMYDVLAEINASSVSHQLREMVEQGLR